MKRQLISSSAYRAVEAIWAAVVMLIVTPILIRSLGTDSYGLWLLLLSGIGLMNFFELGFASAIQRRMAQAIEHQNLEQLNRLYSSGLCLFGLLSVLAVAALFLLAWFPGWLGIDPTHQHLALLAFLFFGLKVVLDFIANAIHGIFSGQLRFDLDSQIAILAMTSKAFLMVLFVKPYGVLGLVVITITTDGLAQLAKFLVAYRIQPGLCWVWPAKFRQDCSDLFGYARHVILIELARLVQEKSVVILISHLLGLVAISLYAIADRLLRQATMLVQTMTAVLQPYLIRKVEQGQLDISLMDKTMQLHAWLSAIVLLPILLCGPAFILLWVGPEFAVSQSLLLVLVLAALFRVLSLPISQFLLAEAKHQWIAPLELAAAVIYMVLILLFGRWYGLHGIVWGGVVTSLVIHTFGYAMLAALKLRIRFWRSVFLVGRLLLMFIVIFAVSRSIALPATAMNWFTLPLWVLLSISVATVMGYFWLLDHTMRGMLRRIVLERLQAAGSR